MDSSPVLFSWDGSSPWQLVESGYAASEGGLLPRQLGVAADCDGVVFMHGNLDSYAAHATPPYAPSSCAYAGGSLSQNRVFLSGAALLSQLTMEAKRVALKISRTAKV